MSRIETDFRGELPSVLTPFTVGNGRIERTDGIRFVIDSTPANRYSDAQISDYAQRDRRDYPWQPPMQMTVRAWASHSAAQLRGTAGFGLWNQPFMPGQRWPRLPRNAWFFFAGPPSNMALARGVPGFGWKAATLDARRPLFLALAPTAPLAIFLMRIPSLYRVFYPVGQRAMGVSEVLLTDTTYHVDLREPHTYRMDWLPRSVLFTVDGQIVLRTPSAPRGRLGFIAWLDNQYAVVTPQGSLAMGITEIAEQQWLCLESLVVERLD